MSAAASPRQRQPHAWSLGGCLPWQDISSQVPSDDLFACNPSPEECGETDSPAADRGLHGRHGGGRHRQCLTAMGRRHRNRPKGLFAVARRGFGYPIMAALPEAVPDPDIQACCVEAPRGTAGPSKQDGTAFCAGELLSCMELRCCRQGWMLPLVGTAVPGPGYVQPRTEVVGWER